ncbi:MAG: UvrB/UvrC motif-containing protein [Bacilli bacterium]
MFCDECKTREAVVHLKKQIDQHIHEVHLCEGCAREKQSEFFSPNEGKIIGQLLVGMMGFALKEGNHTSRSVRERYVCPECGLTLQQFQQAGRFGCQECYEAFSPVLDTLIQKLHSGNIQHHGKMPKRQFAHFERLRKISDLKEQLQRCVAAENFEEAVIVRDEIRKLESEHARGGTS